MQVEVVPADILSAEAGALIAALAALYPEEGAVGRLGRPRPAAPRC